MKDHEKRELLDRLTAVAVAYNGHQQLRARIREVLFPYLELNEAATASSERCTVYSKEELTSEERGARMRAVPKPYGLAEERELYRLAHNGPASPDPESARWGGWIARASLVQQEEDQPTRGTPDSKHRIEDDRTPVLFVGCDPLALTIGAVKPMIPDSWRFGFYVSGDQLCFGHHDDGDLISYEAVRSCPEHGKPLLGEHASHFTAWRLALVSARDAARVVRPDVDDRSYWDHELRAFDSFLEYASGLAREEVTRRIGEPAEAKAADSNGAETWGSRDYTR